MLILIFLTIFTLRPPVLELNGKNKMTDKSIFILNEASQYIKKTNFYPKYYLTICYKKLKSSVTLFKNKISKHQIN